MLNRHAATVWQSKEGRRAAWLFGMLRYPMLGALVGVGVLGVARWLGPRIATDLGRRGGEGFAEGVARVQSLAVSGGRWSRYS